VYIFVGRQFKTLSFKLPIVGSAHDISSTYITDCSGTRNWDSRLSHYEALV